MTDPHEMPAHPSSTTRALLGRALLVGCIAATVVLTIITLNSLVAANREAAKSRQVIQAQTRLLVECTTPPEERTPPLAAAEAGSDDCYVRSSSRTAQAVDSIGSVVVVAAACGAEHPGDVPATRACVTKALAKEQPK